MKRLSVLLSCNLEKLRTPVVDDLEFYHYRTRLAMGKQTLLDAINQHLREDNSGAGFRDARGISAAWISSSGYRRCFNHPWTQDHGVVGEAKFEMLRHQDEAWKVRGSSDMITASDAADRREEDIFLTERRVYALVAEGPPRTPDFNL